MSFAARLPWLDLFRRQFEVDDGMLHYWRIQERFGRLLRNGVGTRSGVLQDPRIS